MKPDLALARAAAAAVFVTGGCATLRDPVPRVVAAAPLLARLRIVVPGVPCTDLALVRLNAAAHLAGGVALAAGLKPRAAALILAASLIPTTAAGHPFWTASPVGQRTGELIQAAKNLAVLSALARIASG